MGITAGIAEALTYIGVGADFAATAAPIIAGVGEGALAGGAIGEVTTGKPLTGAIEGGITGGVLSGVGPVISDATGVGLTGTDAALGAGVGAAESAVTHTNPLTGALEGGVGGALSGAFSGASTASTPDAAPGVTGGTPAASGSTLGSAAGSGVAGGAAAPAASVGPSLTGGFSPDAVAGSSNVLAQLGAAPAATPASPTLFVDDAGVSGVPPSGSAASANSQFLNAAPADAGAAGPSTANVGALSGVAAGDAGGSGLSGLLDKLGIGSGDSDWISAGGAAKLGIGGLTAGFDLTRPGVSALPGYSALNPEATTLGTQGQQLASYVNNGTLPPGAKTAVDQATQQAIATIKSKYASMGQSGSTSEAQAIASVQQQSAEEGFQIANQLLASGISESQLASGIYQTILQANVSQNNEVTSAISGLAGALGGGGTAVRVV